MFIFSPTPSPDDRLLVLVQRCFYGEASHADFAEFDRLLVKNPKLCARRKKIEHDLRENRVFILSMKSFVKELDDVESEDLSAFMRTSRRNREMYQSLQVALEDQARRRRQRNSAAPSQ